MIRNRHSIGVNGPYTSAQIRDHLIDHIIQSLDDIDYYSQIRFNPSRKACVEKAKAKFHSLIHVAKSMDPADAV